MRHKTYYYYYYYCYYYYYHYYYFLVKPVSSWLWAGITPFQDLAWETILEREAAKLRSLLSNGGKS